MVHVLLRGGYCRDDQTIASYLQKDLNNLGYYRWSVYNKGLCGPQNCLNRAFLDCLSENDVVCILQHMKFLPCCDDLFQIMDITDVYNDIEDLSEVLINSPFHCGKVINKKIADRIFQIIEMSRVLDSQMRETIPVAISNYYIPLDMRKYFKEYCQRIRKKFSAEKIGSIVMNCNPFTLGHRHLIEEALKIVDGLYLFIVEEDKSHFSFKDRFKMVELGIEGLEGVVAVPSGKYILSQKTFEQYFMKEQIETVEAMDYDIQIFGDVVAQSLGIKYRFIGEEPFDKVTKEYNETMKRLLPDFGVKVVEIPRMTGEIDGHEKAISASLVRKAILERRYELLGELCPETTVKYLMSNL